MTTKTKTVPAEADAYSIEEFCLRNSLSLPTFYKYADIMPDTFQIGARRLISREAAERWRRAREIASAETAAASRDASTEQK